MVSRILALLVWAAVAASAAHWGLRWIVKPAPLPPGTSAVSMASVPRGDILKLLSGPAAPESTQPDASLQSALAARVQLLGVVAPRASSNGPGVALLVVDGKPARAFKTGHAVDGDLVVQTISQQTVEIGPRGGAAVLSLELPLLQAAATGTLPPAGTFGGASAGASTNAPPSDGNYVPAEAYAPPESMPPPGAGGMADTPVEGADAAPQGAESQAPAASRQSTLRSRLMRRAAPPSGT